MNAGGDQNDALPALPRELNDKLFALLFGDPARREGAFAELLTAHRDHAEALRAHWQHHLGLEREAEAPREIGDAGAIAGYRLLEVLGEGGFGTVYLAEQKEPVRRRVALKVIKLGMDSKAVLARFALERQALAVMNHDAIAKVYDCGITDRGQSYFVMELVEGEPLTGYCDKHRLGLKDRIEIIQQVCAGIQHAHQKGVLHRDLKPGNVLVAKKGDKHVAKIIDFGVARATNHQLVAQTIFTERGVMVGTPEYMSPEQACGEALRIDTRTDVYSLGVMLYELLVGELPFPSAELRRAGLLEIQRKLREDEPAKPSTKLTTRRALANEWAQKRNISVEGLRRELSGDLDWVVLKAMAKEPDRRYESATALADDLGRYLAHEPLRAGPPSGWYRLRKWVRRYRGQVLAGSAVLLALVGGGIGTFVQYLRAEDKAADALQQKGKAEANERLATQNAAAAEQRAKELEQVLSFQESQWEGVDGENMGVYLRRSMLESAKEARRVELQSGLAGVNFTSLALGMLRENLFDRSLAAIGKDFVAQPLVKARLLQSVADTLRQLGLLDRATAPQTEALEIRRQILGDDHPDTMISVGNMGVLLQAQGKLAEAEPYYRAALEKTRRILGDEHQDTLASIGNMGRWLCAQGKLTEAEPYLREALEVRRRTRGDEHPDTLNSIHNLGVLLSEQGKLTEAEPYVREALEKRQRTLGDDHPDTLLSIMSIGSLLQAQGRRAEAESFYRDALERFRRILGDDHPSTLAAINNLSLLLTEQGKRAEAEPLYRDALERFARILGDDHPDTLIAITNMAFLLHEQGKVAEAEPLVREALEKSRRILGDEHPKTLLSMSNMGSLLMAQGRFAEAEPLLRDALEGLRQVLGDDHLETLSSIRNMGSLLHRQGKLTEAEPFLREALETSQRTLGDAHPKTLLSISNMGSLLRAQGKLAEAEPFLRDALEGFRRILGDDHPHTLTSIGNMGLLLREQGKLTEAEAFLREALEKNRQILGDEHPNTLLSITNMGHVLQDQGRFAEAEALFREALEQRRWTFGDDHPDTLASIYYLGKLLVQAERHRDAVAVLSAAEAAMRRALTGAQADRLASFLRTLGKAHAGLAPKEFALAEAELRESHAVFSAARGPAHRFTRECAQALVELYEAWHAAEPGKAHDNQAAEWKAKLER